MSWLVEVDATGPVAAGAVAWTRNGETRLSVIVKAAATYGTDGSVTPMRRADIPAPSDDELAPFVPQPEVLVIGSMLSGPARIALEAPTGTLLDKRAQEPSELAPVKRTWPFDGTDARREVVAVPEDSAVFQRSPDDQRCDDLKDLTHVVLEGVDADASPLRIHWPLLAIEAWVELPPKPLVVSLITDTLVLDASNRRLEVLMRGSIPVADPKTLPQARVRVVADAGHRPARRGRAGTALLEDAVPESRPRTGTVALDDDAAPRARAAATMPLESQRGRNVGRTNDPLPFAKADNTAPSAPKSAEPIIGAPWSPVNATPAPKVGPHRHTVDLDSALKSMREPSSAEPSPPVEATAAKEPAAAAKKIAWREDPPEAIEVKRPAKPVTKTPRKNLNDALYGDARPKKRR